MNRASADTQERIEWQLDQIRQALMFLAALVALALAVGGTFVLIEVLAT